jgi:hypothetical protein
MAALELLAVGHNDCEVARRLGIPRTTVRDWRRPTYVRKAETTICPRCWRPSQRPIAFSPADYSELLALYLGDAPAEVIAFAFSSTPATARSSRTLAHYFAGASRPTALAGHAAGRGRPRSSACTAPTWRAYFPSTAPARSTSARSFSKAGRPRSWSASRGRFFEAASDPMAACS